MEPDGLVAQIAIVAVPLLLAIVCHEVAHGAVAYLCGDPTAAQAGRLTLNPLPHVDPVGTLLLPGVLLLAPLLLGTKPFVFGWAKPVPIDPRRFRHPRRDELLVALAGPATNLALAGVATLILAFLLSADVAASGPVKILAYMAATGIQVNCLLAVFNLLPIPPLDGGRVLSAILPAGGQRLLAGLERVGLVVVLLVVMNTQVLSTLVRPLVTFFFGLAE